MNETRVGARAAFVTGAAGFLGRHLVEELSRRAWQVAAFCLYADEVGLLEEVASVVVGDITDAASIRAGMPAGMDAIFHMAADTSSWSRNARRQYEVNVIGTRNMIDVALERSADRFIYTSSISAYGYQPGRLISETTPSNASAKLDNYGQTKLQAERQIKRATAQRGLDAVILNPVNILGSYDRSNWSRQLSLPIAQGRLPLVPPGAATWAYVNDVVDAHIAAAQRGRSGENYLLGGVQASFKEVVNQIEDILGRPQSRRVTPAVVLRVGLWAATAKSMIDRGEPALTPERYRRAVGNLLCDDEKAQQELGYRHTDLRTMLTDTIDWLREEHLLEQAASPASSR
jgi:dihydroflavonol-4-reductase